jgi:hypothetical protein
VSAAPSRACHALQQGACLRSFPREAAAIAGGALARLGGPVSAGRPRTSTRCPRDLKFRLTGEEARWLETDQAKLDDLMERFAYDKGAKFYRDRLLP